MNTRIGRCFRFLGFFHSICYDLAMIKSIDRYIWKEIIAPFSIGLLVYTFTLLIHNIFHLSNMLIAKRASGMVIFKILLNLLPFVLTVTLPIACLMGVLAGLSRMSTDSEIIAFKTMGITNRRILRPVLIFSFLCTCVTALFTMYLTPEANFRFSKLRTQMAVSTALPEIKPRVFYSGMQFYPYVLYFNDKDNRSQEWKNIFLYHRRDRNIITAKTGKFITDQKESENHLILKDVMVHSANLEKTKEEYPIFTYEFKKEKIDNLFSTRLTRSTSELNIWDIQQKLKAKPGNRLLIIEFYRKFSIPFACLALGFLALSMGIFTKKGGNINGFIISRKIWPKKGIFPPFWGFGPPISY